MSLEALLTLSSQYVRFFVFRRCARSLLTLGSIALVKNEIRIVQASLLGSILANLLLILGMCFCFGGLRFREQIYNSTVTQMSACLLCLAVMSLLLPVCSTSRSEIYSALLTCPDCVPCFVQGHGDCGRKSFAGQPRRECGMWMSR
jgi:hypothetical protein